MIKLIKYLIISILVLDFFSCKNIDFEEIESIYLLNENTLNSLSEKTLLLQDKLDTSSYTNFRILFDERVNSACMFLNKQKKGIIYKEDTYMIVFDESKANYDKNIFYFKNIPINFLKENGGVILEEIFNIYLHSDIPNLEIFFFDNINVNIGERGVYNLFYPIKNNGIHSIPCSSFSLNKMIRNHKEGLVPYAKKIKSNWYYLKLSECI